MTVTEYLITRLQSLGVRHMFGVPGDFNLSLLEKVLKTEGMDFIGCCNELNAAYAADGYARIAGMAALVTTYGVGELSAIAGIAGAYAEKAPIVCINGAPPLHMIRSGALVHHTMADGNYNNMRSCFANFTVAQSLLTPENAKLEIDRVLAACVAQSRPVYLQIPSDVAEAKIRQSDQPPLPSPGANLELIRRAAEAVSEKLEAASHPAILVDADVGRFGLSDEIMALSVQRGIPVAFLLPAKGMLPEDQSNVIGMYRGKASNAAVLQAVEGADALLCIGTRFTDTATGLFSHQLNPKCIVDVQHDSVTLDDVVFREVPVKLLIEYLLKGQDIDAPRVVDVQTQYVLTATSTDPDRALTQDHLWESIQAFLRPNDILISDTGTAFFGCSQLRLPKDTRFLAQPVWAALGYGIPATLGACAAAPDRRVVLIVGDGGLQMSVQELSTLVRLGLSPIIVLLNNDGYTIERLILGPDSPYNDIQPWRYAELLAVFGGSEHSSSCTVTTQNELELALKSAPAQKHLMLIEALLPRLDVSPTLASFLKRVAKSNFELQS